MRAACTNRAIVFRDSNNISRMGRRHFGSVRKLPSGRWQASYWHDGRRHAATETFRAKGDALAWLATKEADIVRGTWVAPPTGKVTFGEYSLSWLQRQGHLRPAHRELYEFLLRKHIEPTFGGRPLTAIAYSEVVAWYRGLGARVRGRHPSVSGCCVQRMPAAVADGCSCQVSRRHQGCLREDHVEEQADPDAGRGGRRAGRGRGPSLSGHDRARRRLRVFALGSWRLCGVIVSTCCTRRWRVAETITELVGGERFAGRPKTESGRRTVAIPSSIVPIVSAHLEMIGQSLAPFSFRTLRGAISSGTISANVYGSGFYR